MAYDVELAERLRDALAAEPEVVERRMFGGLAFLLGGHLAVSAGSKGGLMLRVDREAQDELLEDPRISRFVMRGRELDGWLQVSVDDSVSDDELDRWVQHGVDHARSLPPR